MSNQNSEPNSGSVPSAFISSFASSPMSRRTLLMGTMGAAAFAALAACGSGSTSSSTTGAGASSKASGVVTFGSNQSDAVPKQAYADIISAYQAQSNGVTVTTNTVDHNTFQENINNYLQGSPDDVFTWFAGYRMRFFAEQGLAGDISDVWKNVTGMSDGFKAASTGTDGKQ